MGICHRGRLQVSFEGRCSWVWECFDLAAEFITVIC